MLGEQRLALGEDDRLDALGHELAMPGVQLGLVVLAEHRQAEVQVGLDVQPPSQVVHVILVVARLVGGFVEDAAPAQPVAPGVIAVAGQQGVVEIE
ncbi:hypothetical protein D3C81_1531960 [compost metagenome]